MNENTGHLLNPEFSTNFKQHLSDRLSDYYNRTVQIQALEEVCGGDINKAYKVVTSIGAFFLKQNDALGKEEMFLREKEGLDMLSQTKAIHVPAVILSGNFGSSIYLLIEYVEKGTSGAAFWFHFGSSMACLHSNTGPGFGFERDNYIGYLGQSNKWTADWTDFFAAERILPLVKMLVNKKNLLPEEFHLVHRLCSRLPSLIPSEPPALLHGDLWSGNFLVNTAGKPCIFDPAVYYGHREMDIAMTLLFGGFDQQFYAAYNEVLPLQPGWEERVSLFQLYPLLVHAILFGGQYVAACKQIIKRYA